MKRIFILIAVVLFTVGTVFADEAVLIDFTKLRADILPDEAGNPTQNRQTMMDYGPNAGNSFTAEQKQAMKTSLAIPQWEVQLASSSRNIGNVRQSYTLEAPSRREGEGGIVMGVRIHFPVEPFGSWAIIRPPFDIPAYELSGPADDEGNITPNENPDVTQPSRFEAPAGENGKVDNTQPAYGVVKNVGAIKSVAVNVYGLNFPHGLSTILIDPQGNEKTVFMGFLGFDGWGELRWENPAYVQNVRDRELRLYPLYPEATPFVKFGGFLIQRDASQAGGDYVGYFRDVKIIYDKAVLDVERDIDDERLWGIINERENAKKNFEMQQFGQSQVLRYIEQQKKASESTFTPTPAANE